MSLLNNNVAAFVIGILALVAIAREIRRGTTQRRRQATFDFMVATLGRNLALRAAGFPELVKADVDAYLAASAADREEHVREYLDRLEVEAIAINLEIYEREVAERYSATQHVRAWALYEPWILARRKRCNAPALYREFEALAKETQTRFPGIKAI